MNNPMAFWPITISAANCKLDVTIGVTAYHASIALGTYNDRTSFLAAVTAALTALATGGVWTVVASASGRVTISNTTQAFTAKWLTGTNTATNCHLELGFDNTDVAGIAGTGVTGTHQHRNGWYAGEAVQFDSGNEFEQPDSVITVSVGGTGKSIFEAERTLRTIRFGFLPDYKTKIASEDATTSLNEALERLWRNGRGRFRWYDDPTLTGADYFLDYATGKEFRPVRLPSKAIYATQLIMRAYL